MVLADVVQLASACQGKLKLEYKQMAKFFYDHRHKSWLATLANNRMDLVGRMLKSLAQAPHMELEKQYLPSNTGDTESNLVEWQFRLSAEGNDDLLVTWRQAFGLLARGQQADGRRTTHMGRGTTVRGTTGRGTTGRVTTGHDGDAMLRRMRQS